MNLQINSSKKVSFDETKNEAKDFSETTAVYPFFIISQNKPLHTRKNLFESG